MKITGLISVFQPFTAPPQTSVGSPLRLRRSQSLSTVGMRRKTDDSPEVALPRLRHTQGDSMRRA